jgi:hypothetical protein
MKTIEKQKLKRKIGEGFLLASLAWELGFVSYGINRWANAGIDYRCEVKSIVQREGQYDRFKHEDVERRLEYASSIPIMGYYGIALAGALSLGFSGLRLIDRSKIK